MKRDRATTQRIAERPTSETDSRRKEDQIREQLRDERAIVIRRPTTPHVPERRRGRTDVELRQHLEEIRRQWDSSQRPTARPRAARPRPPRKSR